MKLNKFIKFYKNQEERAKEMWGYTYDKLIPLEPLFKLKCPVCGSDDVSFKHRNVFSPYRNQYRIDMYFKCMKCYHIFVFGVPIDKSYFEEIGIGSMHVREVIFND